MSNAFQLTIPSDGIARLVFDLPDQKVNKLSQPVIEELEAVIENLAHHPEVKALVITSAKEGIFIAGADIQEFDRYINDAQKIEAILKSGHRVYSKLADLPFPTIAVINGACLGGGLELALACKYRLVSDSPKTLLGLPEVSLGIIPGWGGTQRLPRLVGLVEGLQMILGAKPVKAAKAYKIKLADAIAAAEFLPEKTEEFIKTVLSPEGKKAIHERRKRNDMKSWLMESNPLGRHFVFDQAKKDVLKKTKGHYPAPLVVLKVIEETYTLPLEEGLSKEVAIFIDHFPQIQAPARHLIQLFFMSEEIKKNPGIPAGAKARKISSGAVIGAGTMGSGIVWLFSNFDIPVRMKDISWEQLGKGMKSINDIYFKAVRDKRLKSHESNLKFHKVSGTIDYSGFQNADIVIEAATENLELKEKIFRDLEQVVASDTIIATNTSSLPISQMADHFQHPERFIGMHFFNPVNKMPLVEVVQGPKTSPESIATVVELCKKLKKVPIVVKDCPGFLVNRIFVLGANEVLWLLEEGVPLQRLEKLMLDFGMPMSPFQLSDEVGNDVSYKVSKIFEKAYGERMTAPPILEKLNEANLLGKKSGKGFYIYNGKEARLNPEINQFLSKKSPPEYSDQDIMDRIIFTMVNEASRCLEDNIVSSPIYVDMALILGTGFPPFRGGLLHYADDRGVKTVYDRLTEFEQKAPRFKPSAYLERLAQENRGFYSMPLVVVEPHYPATQTEALKP